MNTSKIVTAIEVTMTTAFALVAAIVIAALIYSIVDDMINHDANVAAEAAYCAGVYNSNTPVSEDDDYRCN